MYGFDGETGEEVWSYKPDTYWNLWASRPGSAGYGIYIGVNQDNWIYAFDVHTGKLIWKYEGPGVFYNNHCQMVGGKVYVQTGTNNYRNPSTGEWGHSELVRTRIFTPGFQGKRAFGRPNDCEGVSHIAVNNLDSCIQWYEHPQFENRVSHGGERSRKSQRTPIP